MIVSPSYVNYKANIEFTIIEDVNKTTQRIDLDSIMYYSIMMLIIETKIFPILLEMSIDKFYTRPEIAQQCYNTLLEYVDLDYFDYILEPSAGNGAFSSLLPKNKAIAIDIEPAQPNIMKMDFFSYQPDKKKKYLVIGNPPFGKISSLAIKFFNRASEFAQIIAFIIPRTFKRVSVHNQLNLNFHLYYTQDLPLKPCCFEPKMSAKCCFQIWVKYDIKRTKVIYPKTHPDFSFLEYGVRDINGQPTPPKNADFVLKAYGANCGTIQTNDLQSLRPKSWHWIKSNIDIELLKSRFEQLDYSISKDTVRQDSLGRGELIWLYNTAFESAI